MATLTPPLNLTSPGKIHFHYKFITKLTNHTVGNRNELPCKIGFEFLSAYVDIVFLHMKGTAY